MIYLGDEFGDIWFRYTVNAMASARIIVILSNQNGDWAESDTAPARSIPALTLLKASFERSIPVKSGATFGKSSATPGTSSASHGTNTATLLTSSATLFTSSATLFTSSATLFTSSATLFTSSATLFTSSATLFTSSATLFTSSATVFTSSATLFTSSASVFYLCNPSSVNNQGFSKMHNINKIRIKGEQTCMYRQKES